ncbi:MAG TPA: amidohydrolase family protein [Chitinophagaceae bacterium]|nr:amidohydrolase family protein [Chitinophagaceae bacterium]
MQKIFFSILLSGLVLSATSQETVLPAPAQKGTMYVMNATIHVGNGTVIDNGVIQIKDNKIEKVGTDIPVPAGAKTIDAKGKHVYPGVILPISNLGLVEISAVRASTDVRELGDMNPNVRSIVAYNTDSKVINTLRSQGVLLANIVPQGTFLAGSSSVVQLDAWNYQDAAYKTDAGMHLYMPSLMARPSFGGFGGGGGRFGPQQNSGTDPVKEGLNKIEGLKTFFNEAKAYFAEGTHVQTNLKFEAVKGLFDRTQKFYVHGNTVRQMLIALDFVKQYNFDVVIVGGSDSWQIADLLKQHNVAVVLQQMHSLPTATDDDIDQPYKTAAALQKAGVVFSISDDDAQTRGKNILFNAGTAATYGLTKEQALQAITLNAAKIMGVADKTGSIEPGKDANIVISEGDILDMKTSKVTAALIQGRVIDLTDKHKLLNERFNKKYDIKQPTTPAKPF